MGKKLSAGNGADASHASYLPDCDYLRTTDKAYADVLRAAAATLGAPQGGAVVLVKPHRDGWSLRSPRRCTSSRRRGSSRLPGSPQPA